MSRRIFSASSLVGTDNLVHMYFFRTIELVLMVRVVLLHLFVIHAGFGGEKGPCYLLYEQLILNALFEIILGRARLSEHFLESAWRVAVFPVGESAIHLFLGDSDLLLRGFTTDEVHDDNLIECARFQLIHELRIFLGDFVLFALELVKAN